MEKETLVTMLQRQNPVLAEAVSRMIDYIQDRWAAPYPSKEQTEAVNAYPAYVVPIHLRASLLVIFSLFIFVLKLLVIHFFI